MKDFRNLKKEEKMKNRGLFIIIMLVSTVIAALIVCVSGRAIEEGRLLPRVYNQGWWIDYASAVLFAAWAILSALFGMAIYSVFNKAGR
jgi:hypothetical protein